MVFIGVALTTPAVLMMLFTNSLAIALWMNFLYHIPITMFVGMPPKALGEEILQAAEDAK